MFRQMFSKKVLHMLTAFELQTNMLQKKIRKRDKSIVSTDVINALASSLVGKAVEFKAKDVVLNFDLYQHINFSLQFKMLKRYEIF